MKIAFIGVRGYPYVYSGYETFVSELGERLQARGHEVTVYCHRSLFPGRPKMVNGIHLVYLPTIESKILSQFLHSGQAVLHACLRRYDVILAVNAANGPFGLFFRLFGRKTAINVDGLEWLRPKWWGMGSRYFHWAAGLATRLYDAVITDSLAMQRIYQQEFACQSEVIAYGANVYPAQNPELIGKWGLTAGQYYLIVGRLIPDNNAELIVREFLASGSRRQLVIVGDVPYRDAYARRIRESGDQRLLFTGYVRAADELAALYQHSFAYLHGHEFGGTNPALLQALANGCAVCALDTVFNREVLADGTYGRFFGKNLGGLSAEIQALEIRAEVVQTLRQRARQRVAEAYTWEKIVQQYEDLLRQLTAVK